VYTRPQASLNKRLIKLLVRKKTRRGPSKKRRGTGSKILSQVSIDYRPKHIGLRQEIGHWEGDLVIGKGQKSAIGTIVERKSRYTLILKLNSRKADEIAKMFSLKLDQLDQIFKKTRSILEGFILTILKKTVSQKIIVQKRFLKKFSELLKSIKKTFQKNSKKEPNSWILYTINPRRNSLMKYKTMEKLLEALEKELKNLGIKKSSNQYFSDSIKAGVIAFIFAWLLWNLFFETLLEGLLFSIIISIITIILLLSKPKKKLILRGKKIEKHLPFALMQLSVDLNTGIHFDTALKRIAKANYGELSKEISLVLSSGKKSGFSTPQILLDLKYRNYSKKLNRVVSQLISIYEHGTQKNPGEIVRRMALEQLSVQKAMSKEYTGKLVVFSLGFIALSAIIPALFQAFTIVGSSFIEIPFDGLEILLIVAVLFPLIDVLMLLYIKSITPEFLKG
ncbi:IS30 family transposase, partial [archaeon]|nr:IS30 family transposase [archaeon]